MSLDKNKLAADLDNIASMLWGAESLTADVPMVDKDGVRLLDLEAAISTVRCARQLLQKLSNEIDGSATKDGKPKGTTKCFELRL